MSTQPTRYVLQICHSYYEPFLDCARQYTCLFKDTPYKVITVFLQGEADSQVSEKTASHEVIFLGYQSHELKGMKIGIIKKIRSLVARYDFAACIAHRAKPTYVALMATQLPVFSIQHSFGNFSRFSRRLMVNTFKSRLTLLAVSNAVRDEIRDDLPGWPAEKIETLYNRIDLEKARSALLDRTTARATMELPADAWIVGSVGRLHPDKDPQTLIRGFAEALPDLPEKSMLVLIGKGRLEDELKRLVNELKLQDKVRLLGPVPEARRYFKAFDVFTLSSDYEPFGMVLLEAMVADVPIISTDCGGAAEVVSDVGELFPLGDSSALADALCKLSKASHIPTVQSMQQRLHEHFSDNAIRQSFWKLKAVENCLKTV